MSEILRRFVPALAVILMLLATQARGEPPPPSLAMPPAVAQPTVPGYQPPPKTLEKIRQFGAIYVGHREASIPFSYMDADGKVIGYSWDLCMRVVDAVRERLGRPDLPVVPVLGTSATRLMMIETGTVDLECGSTTNTEQRARYVAFSNTFFVTGIKALVRKDSGIRSIADLRGKVVVTTAGTTTESYVRAAVSRRGIFVNYRSGRVHTDGFNDVLQGRADAFVLDDVLLQGLLANAPEADAFRLVVVDESFGLEPYGIMLRKGDPEFKKLVDDTLVSMMQSGEFERLYAKWFESPIPPKGIRLNVPMGPELKQLIKTPNDRGI